MRRAAYARATGWTAGFRRFVCLIALLAFTFQGYLVQTHIHGLPQSLAAAAGVSVSAPGDTNAPFDADHCLICQEFLHAGTYVTPAAAAVLPPTAVVAIIAFVFTPLAPARSPSHIWKGRAPPRA